MRRTFYLFWPVILLSACSGEDVQVSLEKEQLGKKQDKNLIELVPVSVEVQTEPNTISKSTENPISQVLALPSANKKSPIEPLEAQEFEASLASVDDAQILKNYEKNGNVTSLEFSGKPTYLKLGGVPLKLSDIRVKRSNQGLVSNVKSVSGATSITGDPTGFGFTIGLSGDYLFDFDKDTLTPKAQEALLSVYTLYKDYQGTNIKIAGHTDSKGANDYNLALSKRRAKTVKNWFQNKGISSSLVTTQGFGETKPVAPNSKNGKDYPEGRALNRRVDISVKTTKKINHLPVVSIKTAIK